jgi:hypothetical protein
VRLRIVVQSILVGWATLVPITYLLERFLLPSAAHLLGATWFPTARLTLDCLSLATTGWVIGRVHRFHPVLGVLVFSATLTFRDFDPLLAFNVPWLIKLAADALHDSLYFDSLAATAAQHILLFGSLIAGAVMSRPLRTPLSIFGGKTR